jgi:transcriptional regulator with XRE-family HTH domain
MVLCIGFSQFKRIEESCMVEGETPAKRRRLGAHGMIFRRRRIFARLREGFTYEEIAAEEGVSHSRIRQIVSEELQKRAVDSGADHAKLQLDRLAPAVQLGAEAIAAGDVSAINPYLKTLDRLDRYQSVAGAHQGYDDEARKKLMDRINRMAENLGVDEAFAAAVRERLKAVGEIPADEPDEPDEPDDAGAPGPAGSPEFSGEADAPEASL